MHNFSTKTYFLHELAQNSILYANEYFRTKKVHNSCRYNSLLFNNIQNEPVRITQLYKKVSSFFEGW